MTDKEKNPKRVAAGKKGAETKKINAELRRKESESIKKENMKLKEKEEVLKITKDPEPEPADSPKSKNNYILPVLAVLGISGIGYYVYNNKKQKPVQKENKQEQEIKIETYTDIDPFEFK